MARSTVHYADSDTNSILKKLHNKLRPAGTPVQRVEYIIELLLLRIFEVKIKHEKEFEPLRKFFKDDNYHLLFSHLLSLTGEQIKAHLNKSIFPFYGVILSKAREVYNGNLSQKVQDVLVLIDEVFSNSSFTTNVQSGNMNEIIGLVAEIDESRILKTDLLGDAIESALAETGGTQDIGLYRTPNHIRQMMVAMVDPTFNDIIFDPACGTGGFLFDCYQYVLEKISKEGNWPSEDYPPNHPELNKYFRSFFKKSDLKMPDKDTANHFYRAGIGGIEYLGTIRKMAAINLYIRGLNPQNIQQGDALKLFDPSTDGGTKSLVIANPPFGAEKDQKAYPNVWDEFSRESETTILFVKLMFDHLRQGGRCAVVVSEGFLTWGQNSARAMRNKLLEEANLRAVISVPQGVFVSKNGQGAKTSILYFEKGSPTDFVWHYKIENDGFSMGTNRKPIEGNQIPELLKLFAELKEGKIPAETKNSFVIPAEWIKTLDPRIKEKIELETKEHYATTNKEKRKEFLTGLDGKLSKGRIDKDEYKEKVWQFNNVLQNKISNELTKRVEGEYSYSLNLANYRSGLSAEQLAGWKDIFKNIKAKNDSTLVNRYKELKKASPKDALAILASFDPLSALHVDIAREYINKLGKKSLDGKFLKLFTILKDTKQFPSERLINLLTPKSNKVSLKDDILYKQVTIKLYGKGVLLRQEILGEDIKTEGQYLVNTGDFIMSKIDARNGAFGIVPDFLEGAIVTSSFPYFEIRKDKVNPKYIEAMVTQKRFYDQINDMVSGATGRRSVENDDFLSLQIPLPPLEVQNEIVEKIEKQRQIIEGAEKIEEGWNIDDELFSKHNEKIFYPSNLIATGGTPSRSNSKYFEGSINWFKSGELNNSVISESSEKISERAVKESNAKIFPVNTVLIALIGATIGDIGILSKDGAVNQNVGAFLPYEKIIPKYLYWYLRNYSEEIRKKQKQGAQPSLNLSDLKKLEIPLPSIEVQKRIILKLDQQMNVVESTRFLKSEAEEQIQKILNKVWGDKLK